MHLLTQIVLLFATGVGSALFFTTLHLENNIIKLEGDDLLEHPWIVHLGGSLSVVVGLLYPSLDAIFGVQPAVKVKSQLYL